MRLGKKGYAMNLLDTWVDICAFACLVIGFFIALVAGSKVLSVIIVFLAGTIIGRSIYMHKHKLQMRFWYVIGGFIIGLVVGTRYMTYKGVLICFILGAVAGHYIRKHRILD